MKCRVARWLPQSRLTPIQLKRLSDNCRTDDHYTAARWLLGNRWMAAHGYCARTKVFCKNTSQLPLQCYTFLRKESSFRDWKKLHLDPKFDTADFRALETYFVPSGKSRLEPSKTNSNIQKNPNFSENFQTLPNASQCIRMRPSRSEQIRMGPKTWKNSRKL